LFGNLIIDVHIVDQSNRNGRYQQAGSAITDERKSDSSQRHQAGRTSDIDDSREFDTYESKKHPESPRGLIFFVKFIGYILRDLA